MTTYFYLLIKHHFVFPPSAPFVHIVTSISEAICLVSLYALVIGPAHSKCKVDETLFIGQLSICGLIIAPKKLYKSKESMFFAFAIQVAQFAVVKPLSEITKAIIEIVEVDHSIAKPVRYTLVAFSM